MDGGLGSRNVADIGSALDPGFDLRRLGVAEKRHRAIDNSGR